MPDGAAPGGIRKKRQSMAAKRIIWAMGQEIEKAEPPLTGIGFELLGQTRTAPAHLRSPEGGRRTRDGVANTEDAESILGWASKRAACRS